MATIERHPAIVSQNQSDGCIVCENGTVNNLLMEWRHNGTGALWPGSRPPLPGMPPALPAAPGDNERAWSSQIEGVPCDYVYVQTPLPRAQCLNLDVFGKDSVSKGAVFETFLLSWFHQNPELASLVRVCAKRFPQLRPWIFIAKFCVWYMKYAASDGAFFGGLRFLISSKLSKLLWNYCHFWPKNEVFGLPLAEIWRYWKSETANRCAVCSCIFYIPNTKLCDQYLLS